MLLSLEDQSWFTKMSNRWTGFSDDWSLSNFQLYIVTIEAKQYLSGETSVVDSTAQHCSPVHKHYEYRVRSNWFQDYWLHFNEYINLQIFWVNIQFLPRCGWCCNHSLSVPGYLWYLINVWWYVLIRIYTKWRVTKTENNWERKKSGIFVISFRQLQNASIRRNCIF